MSWVREYCQKILHLIWEVERPRHLTQREQERKDEQTAYEQVLDRYKRENPEGIRLYETRREKDGKI